MQEHKAERNERNRKNGNWYSGSDHSSQVYVSLHSLDAPDERKQGAVKKKKKKKGRQKATHVTHHPNVTDGVWLESCCTCVCACREGRRESSRNGEQ